MPVLSLLPNGCWLLPAPPALTWRLVKPHDARLNLLLMTPTTNRNKDPQSVSVQTNMLKKNLPPRKMMY